MAGLQGEELWEKKPGEVKKVPVELAKAGEAASTKCASHPSIRWATNTIVFPYIDFTNLTILFEIGNYCRN